MFTFVDPRTTLAAYVCSLRHNMCARSLSYIVCSLMLFAKIIICFQAAKYSLDISKTNNCKRNSNFNIFFENNSKQQFILHTV